MLTTVMLLFAVADPAAELTELERLAATWATTKTQIVIKADSAVRVLVEGKEQFEGKVAASGGKLTLHKDGVAWFTTTYL